METIAADKVVENTNTSVRVCDGRVDEEEEEKN